MATQVEIANLALGAMGSHAFISSLDEGTEEADTIKRFYELDVLSVLRMHNWNCALKFVPSLPVVPGTNIWNFGVILQIPNDCVKIVRVADNTYRTKRIGNTLHVNSNQPVSLGYVARADEGMFDPLLTQCIVYYLARHLAISLGNNAAMGQQMAILFANALSEARFQNAQENSFERVDPWELVASYNGSPTIR